MKETNVFNMHFLHLFPNGFERQLNTKLSNPNSSPPAPDPHTTTENKSSVLKTAGIAAQSAQSLLPPDWASSSFSLFVT